VPSPLRFLIWTASGISVLAAGRPPDNSGTVPDIVDRYLQASRMQRTVLQNEPVEVEITATLLKSQRRSQLRAVRRVSDRGEITYDVLQTSGDEGIRRQIIGRYLTAEAQSRDTDAAALSRVNYKFRLKAILDRLGRRVYVLQLTPRRKKAGLFKGELWVDEATGMPVRESGQLVKSPSWLIKRIVFVRTYEICDGLAVPAGIDSTVETRVAGPAQLSIRFRTVNAAIARRSN
jgi:hypothetical protein